MSIDTTPPPLSPSAPPSRPTSAAAGGSPSSSTSKTHLTLSQLYVYNCSQRSLKPNSSLVAYFAQFDHAPSHLNELNLSLTQYTGPQGFLPVIDTVIRIDETATSSSQPLTNLKVLNVSDNRITNESLEYLLSALIDRFASISFFRLFMTVGKPFTASTATTTTSAFGSNNKEMFEFSLDLSRNPISSVGGKKISAFLSQLKSNNESGKNRVPVVLDVLNLDNTLIVPAMLEQIAEQATRLKLEVKLGEKLSDPKKELAEIEAADLAHKNMIDEQDRMFEEERKQRRLAEAEKQERVEILSGSEKVVGVSEETGEDIRGVDRSECAVDFASFGDGSGESESKRNDDDDDDDDDVKNVKKTIVTNTVFAGSKLKNAFVFKSNTWKQVLSDEHRTLLETHQVFIKPVTMLGRETETTASISSSQTASQLGFGFPVLPLKSFPENLHQTLISDFDNFKQYWMPILDESGQVDEEKAKMRKNMWVGASVGNGGNSTTATNSANPGGPSDVYEEGTSYQEYRKKMPKKKMSKKDVERYDDMEIE